MMEALNLKKLVGDGIAGAGAFGVAETAMAAESAESAPGGIDPYLWGLIMATATAVVRLVYWVVTEKMTKKDGDK